MEKTNPLDKKSSEENLNYVPRFLRGTFTKEIKMKATIFFKASPEVNELFTTLARSAQSLSSSPFFKGHCSIIPDYYDDPYEGTLPSTWEYCSEKGNWVGVSKRGHKGVSCWRVQFDCTRGWLRDHELGNYFSYNLRSLPQDVVSFESQAPERGVWGSLVKYKQGEVNVPGGKLHVNVERVYAPFRSGSLYKVADKALRWCLRKKGLSVLANVN